jgi:hypothetical protein
MLVAVEVVTLRDHLVALEPLDLLGYAGHRGGLQDAALAVRKFLVRCRPAGL